MIIDVSKSKIIMIGEIDFSEAINEDMQIEPNVGNRLNLPGGIGQCKVYINDIEGPIPHIHVVTKDKKWGSCVCLHDALYFPHGNDNLTKGTFNSKQSKVFNSWMGTKNSANPTLTNFQVSASQWYKAFGEKYGEMYKRNGIIVNVQPDYSRMLGDVNPNLR